MVPSAAFTSFTIFVAGILQNIMNDMDEAAFQNFWGLIGKHAAKSPYMLIISLVTFAGTIPYFIFYGFNNWWFTSGIALFWIASAVSKSVSLPIYKRIFALDGSDAKGLREERIKLGKGSKLRALLNFAYVMLYQSGYDGMVGMLWLVR